MKHLLWTLMAIGTCGCADAVSPATGTIQSTSIAAGNDHSCSLSTDDEVYCWGSNEAGQFGSHVAAPESYRPVRTLLRPLSAVAVAAGDQRTCIIVPEGRPLCAGADRTDGFQALAGEVKLEQIAVTTSICGLATDHTVRCWEGFDATPIAVAPEREFLSIGLGEYGCGLGSDSLAYCWHPGSSDVYRVSDVRFGRISVGGTQVCGVAVADSLGYCVSSAFPDAGTPPEPLALYGGAIPKLRSVSAGGGRVCLITVAGDGYCDGLAIAGGLKWRQLSMGARHVCGITADDVTYCWGSNAAGQLGNGTTTTMSSFTLERPL